jgi:YbbR domain-containing protein
MDRLLEYLGIVKEYARDYILENTGLKVLALLITAVLWLSVASRPPSRVNLSNVAIEFRNLPKSPDLTISKSEAVTARVSLVGPRDVLDSLRSGDLAVIADMTGVEPGVRVIELELDSSRLPASVKAREIEPSRVRVTVERVVEKEVGIVPRFDGSPPPGFEIISRQITPATVNIIGAESAVREINQVSTESVSLTEKTAPFSDMVAIDIGSPNVNIVEDGPRKVMLQVNIGEVRKERVIDHVPVVVESGPPTAQAVPRFVKVTVYGAHSAVDAITASDIKVAVEYPPTPARSKEVTPIATLSPAYSDKVTVQSINPAGVRVR